MISRMGRPFVIVVVVAVVVVFDVVVLVVVVGVVVIVAACLFQMITRKGRPFTNVHPNGLAFCFFSIFIFNFSNFFIFLQKASSSLHFFFFFKP